MEINRNTRQLASLLDEWLKIYLPSVRLRSKCTVNAYESALSLFLDFLERSKGVTCNTFSETCFKKEWIEEWLSASCKERGNSRRTCDLRLSCIRSLLKYPASKNVIYLQYHLDARDIGKLNIGHGRQVEGIGKKEMKALFAAMCAGGKTEQRDRAFFTCMYDTGARAGEMLGIRISDLKLDSETPYVLIRGKGGKMRTLVFSPKSVIILKQYIADQHGMNPNPESYLFYSRIRGRCHPIDMDTVNMRLKHYAGKAQQKCSEIPITLHSHQIRHSACTHWFQDGVNLAQISRYLGHESIETTRIYLGISKEELIGALKKRDGDVTIGNDRYDNVKGGLRSLIRKQKDK